jgi:hypothetical protein
LEKLRSRGVKKSRGRGAEKILPEESNAREVRAFDLRLFDESKVKGLGNSLTFDFSTLQLLDSSTL